MADAKKNGLGKGRGAAAASLVVEQIVRRLIHELGDPDTQDKVADFLRRQWKSPRLPQLKRPTRSDPLPDIAKVLDATETMIGTVEEEPELARQAAEWRRQHLRLRQACDAVARAPHGDSRKEIRDLKKRALELFRNVYKATVSESEVAS